MLPRRHSAIWVLAGTVVAAATSFAFQAYLSLALPDADFGAIASLIVWAVALAVLSSTGVENVMLDAVKGQKRKPQVMLGAFRHLWLVHCCVAYLAVALVGLLFRDQALPAFFLASFAMLLSLFAILSASRQCQDDFRGVCGFMVAPEAAKLAAVGVAVALGLGGLDGFYLGLGTAFTILAVTTVGIGMRRGSLARGPRYLDLVRAGLPYAISSVMFMIYYRSALLVLAAQGQLEEAASLAIIFLFMAAILLLPTAYSQRFLLGRWHTIGGDATAFAAEIKLQLVRMLIFSAPITLIWILASQPVLEFIYGSRYAGAQAYAMWFAAIFLLRALSLPLLTASSIQPLKWGKTAGIVLAAAITALGSVLLTPRLGIEGAFWAGVAAELALISALFFIITRYIRRSR